MMFSGSKEGRKAAGCLQEEGGESCKPAFWEEAEAVRDRWCSSSEEGSSPVCEMAASCENSEEEDDLEAEVEGPAAGSSVHQNTW